VEFAPSAYEAARDADAMLILTDWDEFRGLDLDHLYRELKYPIVVDGRNLYDPQVHGGTGIHLLERGASRRDPRTLCHGSGSCFAQSQRAANQSTIGSSLVKTKFCLCFLRLRRKTRTTAGGNGEYSAASPIANGEDKIGLLSTSPTSESANLVNLSTFTPVISANGNSHEILRILDNSAWASSCAAIFYAHNASDPGTRRYNRSDR
jgi:hypothetical protein